MNITLRSYQSDCQEAVFIDMLEGHRRLACVLPTGSGKTTIFGSIISEYLKSNVGKRVIVVSHLGLLVTQTADRFKQEWGIDTGVLQADTYPRRTDRAIITTMQSMRELNKITRWATNHNFFAPTPEALNVGLIIIDECHYAGAESYQKIMSYFPDATVVGFTATPFRENKLMTNIFDKVSYTTSMQDMIDEGHLVPPKLNLVPFDTTDQADMFAKMVNIYKEKHNGEKSVVFLKTIEEAKLCTQIFRESGISSRAVTSELTGQPRDELLSEFRSGNGPDVLTTVDVLTAGFDSPNLRSIFIPYRVGSVTTYLQRVGRGLRPYKDKLHCDIYAGSISPGIEAGFWEKMTKKMLHQGRKSVDDYESLLEILEYAKNDISAEQYKWTQDVVDMANKVKSKGMDTLFDMIIHQKFPQEMLSTFIEYPPMTRSKKSMVAPTPSQEWYLNQHNINAPGLTKQEASAIIMGHKRSQGWQPPRDEVVPAGKHEGKHFTEVPPAYWGILSKKAPHSEAYQAYMNFRRKIGG